MSFPTWNHRIHPRIGKLLHILSNNFIVRIVEPMTNQFNMVQKWCFRVFPIVRWLFSVIYHWSDCQPVFTVQGDTSYYLEITEDVKTRSENRNQERRQKQRWSQPKGVPVITKITAAVYWSFGEVLYWHAKLTLGKL